MKRCSTLLPSREMQIKNHNEIILILTGMTVIQRQTIPSISEDVGKLEHGWLVGI